MKQFTKEELENIGIYNLRNYARKLGVKAPTKKVKAQLIKEILMIYNKELKPVEKANMGRKVKNAYFVTLENIFFLKDKEEKELNIKKLLNDINLRMEQLKNELEALSKFIDASFDKYNEKEGI